MDQNNEAAFTKCPDCEQLCLKIPNFADGEYLDDDEEPGSCHDCIQNLADAIPDAELEALFSATKTTVVG